jgi:hypothetical protein
MSNVLDRYNVLERSFRNVYGVGVILTMLLQMYVEYFPVADHLTYVVPGICGVPGLFGMLFDELPNGLELIFRDRHPSGKYLFATGFRDDIRIQPLH